MKWKKIVCRKVEEVKVGKDASTQSFRKFSGFEEIHFDRNHNKSRDMHMNMGEFFKYLSDHDCGHIFKDVFGLEGKASESVG